MKTTHTSICAQRIKLDMIDDLDAVYVVSDGGVSAKINIRDYRSFPNITKPYESGIMFLATCHSFCIGKQRNE